jgi:urease accessory protein
MPEPVIVITRPHVPVHDADLSALEADKVVLAAEERRWGRRRVKTRAGRELQLALPTGSRLTPGDILYVGRGWYVRIEAAAEPVLAVTPASFADAVRIAFEVGNRHFTLGVDGGRLLIPDDPAMVQLLTRLDVAFERVQAPFEPLNAAHRHE